MNMIFGFVGFHDIQVFISKLNYLNFKRQDDENNTYSVEENCVSCIESCVESRREIWKFGNISYVY